MIIRTARASALIALLAASDFLSSAHAQDAAPNPLDVLVRTLARMENPAVQANILKGMNASLKGRHGVAAPVGWDELYAKLKSSPNDGVREQAQALAVIFGGSAALDEMRKMLADANATPDARKAALESLADAKDAAIVPQLLDLFKQSGILRAPAIRALASFDDPRIAPALLAGFATFESAEKRDALNTLLVRPATALALLAAIGAKIIDRSAITAPLARQLQSFKDATIDAWMAKNWGSVHTSSAEKQAQIAKMKEFLSTDLILRADPSRGRTLFSQTCAVCHTLFGTGGKIGPELPGSFEDVDYLLQNIVDPNAIIGKDYLQNVVKLKDGQTVSGIVAGDDPGSVTLKTLGGELKLQRADIAEMKVSEQSMMPEGLLTPLDEQSVRDLFAYLRQRAQVPILAADTNVTDFFNGSDLNRWLTPGDDWKLENGELIGRGNSTRPVFIVSDFVAQDFKLTARLKTAGANATAEIVLDGMDRDGLRTDALPRVPEAATANAGGPRGFTGHSLSLGGASPPNTWKYAEGKPTATPLTVAIDPVSWTLCEITVHAGTVRVLLNGQLASEFTIAPGTRTVPALYIFGDAAELRIKDLKLEVAS